MCNISQKTLSKYLYLIALICFIFQLYWAYTLYQIELLTETYYFFYRKIYTLLLSVSIFSFFQTSFTDPGFITDNINTYFIALYRVTRINALQRAKIYNEQTKRRIRLVDEDYESESECDDDDQTFPMPENNLKIAEQYNKDFEINTRLCPKCHIIRVPNVHHCPECHRCVYMLDHHCIWLNICIGQFNQKFFILFCFYLLLTSLIGLGMNMKYLIIINPLSMLANYLRGLSVFTTVFFNVAFILFTVKLLFDQYSNIDTNTICNDTLLTINIDFDNKQCTMVEIRSRLEVIYEIFGSKLSLWWFVPLTRGGLYQVMDNIKKME